MWIIVEKWVNFTYNSAESLNLTHIQKCREKRGHFLLHYPEALNPSPVACLNRLRLLILGREAEFAVGNAPVHCPKNEADDADGEEFEQVAYLTASIRRNLEAEVKEQEEE